MKDCKNDKKKLISFLFFMIITFLLNLLSPWQHRNYYPTMDTVLKGLRVNVIESAIRSDLKTSEFG